MEHKHHGKSSAKFLDSDEILGELDFKGNEIFMDAGCGDGYISIKAIEDYITGGTVYAVDIHEESLKGLREYKKVNNSDNLVSLVADISEGISDIENGSIDVILMVNVFHGFKTTGKEDAVIDELARLIKDDGKIAIVDFNKIDIPHGPSVDIKCSPERLEELFNKHNLKKAYLNEKLGADYPEGKSHYMIIFKKE